MLRRFHLTKPALAPSLFAALILGCDRNLDQGGLADTTLAPVAGTYRLLTIDGRPIPQPHHLSPPNCESHTTSGWLTLEPSGRWGSRDTVVQTCADTSKGLPARHLRFDGLGLGGGIVRRGDTLTFFNAESPPYAFRQAVVRRDTIYVGVDTTWQSWADSSLQDLFRQASGPRVYVRVQP